MPAIINDVKKKKVSVSIQSKQLIDRESPCQIHLAQAISKGERMEFVVQKATELGVHSITPIITAHCALKLDANKLEKKRQQWQAIAISACEQSGRNRIPVLHGTVRLATFLRHCSSLKRWVLDPNAIQFSPKNSEICQEASLLVGPEGGFDAQEIQTILAAGFQSIHLGPRILRTETAAIAGLCILQTLFGDL